MAPQSNDTRYAGQFPCCGLCAISAHIGLVLSQAEQLSIYFLLKKMRSDVPPLGA